MGQKVSPIGLRVGVIRNWDAVWYAEKNQSADLLLEDIKIREFLAKTYKNEMVSRVIIERLKGNKGKKDRVRITLYTARPGGVIGRDGVVKAKTIKDLEYLTKKEVMLNVVEIKHPELDATLVAANIARQLEARGSFRRVQKIAIQRSLKAGAKGVKTLVSGRLAGAEMARAEGYLEGQVPLHTIRADIDYSHQEADTTYGKLGVKVWIYKGEVLKPSFSTAVQQPKRELPARNKPARDQKPRTAKPKSDGKKPQQKPATTKKKVEGGK